MPIAMVRIAPVEQWCDRPKNLVASMPKLRLIEGLTIGIITESMRQDPYHEEKLCAGKWWTIAQESADKLAEIIQQRPGSTTVTICEHLLEMD